MEPSQIVIVIVSITLTLLIVVLSIQVWFILKEIRISMQKVNKMLEDAGKVTGTVSEGVGGMASLVSGLKAGLSFFSSMRHKE